MKNKGIKKGFTLIELLAVIVILAVIALIATPIIVGVINDAKKNAFKDTAYGVMDAGKLYYAGEFGNDNFAGETFEFSGNVDELKLSGEKPGGGTFVISKEGTYAMAIYNQDRSLCAMKNYEEEEIKVSPYKKEDCNMSRFLIGAAKTIHNKNTNGNTEGLFTDDFGNVRYRGSNDDVKNYVTFNNETWRIIGVLNGKVKLIREDFIENTDDTNHIDTFLWDGTNTNDWNIASLQIYLNENYYNRLTDESKNMITEEKYSLGGITTTEIDKKTAYQLERGKKVYGERPIEWTGKIGLMYVSDYGYAASATCNQNLFYYSDDTCKTDDWLYKSTYSQWTITPWSSSSSLVSPVSNDGYVGGASVGVSWLAVRPTVYLNVNVQISVGDGTRNNPYILK